MSLQQPEDGIPAEEVSLSVARPTVFTDVIGMAAPSNGQSTCLSRPVAMDIVPCAGSPVPNGPAGNPKPIGGAAPWRPKRWGNVDPNDKAGSCVIQNTNAADDNGGILTVELESFIVDISIIDAIRRYDSVRAKEVAYDWEVCDDGLLPLNRMSEMMSDKGESRPPVSVKRVGRLFKILNGRHRLAYCFIKRLDKIQAVVVNDGHESYIRDGGESNPGPKARRKSKPGKTKAQPSVASSSGAATPITTATSVASTINLAGAATSSTTASTSSVSSKTGLPMNGNSSQTPRKKVPMVGNSKRQPQPRQARDSKLMDGAINEHNVTEWYLAAVKRGFKNQDALDNFNVTVAGIANEIDPRRIPVCMECGCSDAILCKHYVVNGGVETVDNAIVIPAGGGFFMKWRFLWFERASRMFTWPRFDSSVLVNHYNAGFDPSVIPDTEIWPEMLCYIRLHLHTEYKIDGVFNRPAKLAHCKKLANRFLTDNNIKLSDCLSPEIVNKIQLTVARACDQRDDQTLFKTDDPRRNFWVAPGRIPTRRIIIAAAIISPVAVAGLVSVSLRMKIFVFSRLVQANAEILARGSVLVFWSTLETAKIVMTALAQNIWSGIAMPCLTKIQQLSCKGVATTSTILSTSAILSKPQTLSLANSTCNLLGESLTTSQNEYVSRLISTTSSSIRNVFSRLSVVDCGTGMFALTRSCYVMVSNFPTTVRYLPSSN